MSSKEKVLQRLVERKSYYIFTASFITWVSTIPDPDQRQCHSVCQRNHVLQGGGRYSINFLSTTMCYKVADATSAVANVDDYSGSARLLAATTLRWQWQILFVFSNDSHLSLSRNVLGTKKLGDILSERESIANEMQDLLREATEAWGVTVERVEVNCAP